MSNIVTTNLALGKGTGLGYINYDRDFVPTEEDMEQLVVMVIHNGESNYNVLLGCPVPSRWNNVLFSGTALKGTEREAELITATVLESSPNISYYNESHNVRGRNLIIDGQTWKYVEWTSLALGAFVPMNGSDPLNDFAFKLPVWDGNDIPGNSGTDKLINVVKGKIPPSNEDVILGDYGITTWNVYCFNSDFPTYRFVWKNDYVEANKLVDVATIRISKGRYHSVTGDLYMEYEVVAEYPYSAGYAVWTRYAIYEDWIVGNLYLKNPYFKLELLNSNGVSVKERYVEFAATNEGYHDLERQRNGDVLIFHDNETGEDDYGYLQRQDNLDNTIPDLDFGISSSILYRSYVTFDEQLDALGQEVWDKPFIDKLFQANSDPLENLISVYRTPFAISGGANVAIQIGNYKSSVVARPVNDSQSRKVATLSLKQYYDNFLDIEPYTKLYAYIPMVGLVDLLPSDIRESADLWYTFDCRTGGCVVSLKKKYAVIRSWQCAIGDSLQLSSSNQNQSNINMGLSLFSNATGAVQNTMMGNVAGALNNVAGGASDLGNTYTTTTRGGNLNCSAEMRNGLNIFLIYVRPWYQEPLNYAHTHGKPCNLTKTISTLKGYTKVANNVDLSGIPCSESQRKMIFDILTGGFYI